MAEKYADYSQEELVRLLRERDRKPRFGLVWERDEIEHDKSLNEDFVVLDPIPDLSCGNAPYRNLLIEGDNFDTLRYLRMTHAGRVKCIYIDPPYNTGSKDFIYNDRFVDKDDLYKHSKWLEFLHRRLLIARELLAEDGVVLVSINDENRAKLELLLDQIFPGRRVGSMVWRTKDSGNDAGGNFSQVHEHVLIYANPGFSFAGKPLNVDKYRARDGHDAFALDPITCSKTLTERSNLYYPLQDPETGYWYPCDPNAVWRYASETRVTDTTKLRGDTIEELLRKRLIVFAACKPSEIIRFETREALVAALRQGNGPVLPKKKTPLLREDLPDLEFWIGKPIAPGRPSKKSYLKDKRKLIAPVSSWIAGLNEEIDYLYDELQEELEVLRSPRGGEGTDAINEILGSKAFNHPKPPTLIRALLRQATRRDDLVMDFFAGSGTTAQVVLELNKEDNGARRFILASNTEASMENPDKNICRDVCARRIRGVIDGYRNTAGAGGDFAYLRCRRIPIDRVFTDIQHDQVWFALQLIHTDTLHSFDPGKTVQTVRTERGIVAYIIKITDEIVTTVLTLCEGVSQAVVYSWQPGLLRQRIDDPRITFEPIPQFLMDRFAPGATP